MKKTRTSITVKLVVTEGKLRRVVEVDLDTLRRMLKAASRRASCTSCGKVTEVLYDGDCGRELCDRCREEEGRPRRRIKRPSGGAAARDEELLGLLARKRAR